MNTTTYGIQVKKDNRWVDTNVSDTFCYMKARSNARIIADSNSRHDYSGVRVINRRMNRAPYVIEWTDSRTVTRERVPSPTRR